MGVLTLGAGKLFITTNNSLEQLCDISESIEVPEAPERWPVVNPTLQLQKEATITFNTSINMRLLRRLLYGRKRWRNKRKAMRMLDLKRRRREALREKLRRTKA